MILLAILTYVVIAFATYCYITYGRVASEWRDYKKYGIGKKPDPRQIARDNIEDAFTAMFWPGMLIINIIGYFFAIFAFTGIMIVESIYNFFHKPKG